MNDLVDAVREAFGTQGLLARTQADYRLRSGQQAMAEAVAQAIERKSHLVVEAGTGVGKTYAYLVPALLSGERVVISTATHALQEQLFTRDLPKLVAALGLPLKSAQLKGRNSYLCLQRLAQVRLGKTAPQDPQVLRTVADVERWALLTRSGDLGEMPRLDERSPALPLVTSTKDNCLGSECEHWQACHVNIARQNALQADVVVINHHLLFADWEVKESGVAQLLPNAGVVIVDEAHQLNDTGLQFAGQRLSSQHLIGYARDVLRTGQAEARGMADWLVLSASLEQRLRELRLEAGQVPEGGRLAWQSITPQGLDAQRWRMALRALALAIKAILQPLVQLEASSMQLRRLFERGSNLLQRLAGFASAAPDGGVRWLEVGSRYLRMLESPLTIANDLRSKLIAENPLLTGSDGQLDQSASPAQCAWIFTSATLGSDDQLSWFTQTCGLEHAKVLRVESPFDYASQAAIYVPEKFAAAGQPEHSPQVAQLALQAAQRLGGRTLVLTTTLKALHAIGATLQQATGLFSELEILVQGQAPKNALIERFVAAGKQANGSERKGCILVASASFWEGVDLNGDVLQLVVIDKLPFPPPDSPLVLARSQQLEAVGGNAFEQFMLPEAALALKQGAGRLIRSETDQGVLVVCDQRLLTKRYGAKLLAAIPPMRQLTGVNELQLALEALAARTHQT